jgi:hypothetical protein
MSENLKFTFLSVCAPVRVKVSPSSEPLLSSRNLGSILLDLLQMI